MKYCPKCKTSYAIGQRFCFNDGAPLSLQDPYNLVGRALMEKYRLEALVGIGGMGAVYCADHLGTGRQIAIKILLPNLAIGNPRLVGLFEREAKVVGQLRHENIVDIIDAGVTPDGVAYIAMEWLEGHTLDEELRRNGPLSLKRTSELLRQIAAALQSSHTQHIIHRDLKPTNIFLVKRPGAQDHIKVVDFGISKSIGDTAGSPVSSLMGTPQYASPEQFRLGENIDSRTDIYSLGVLIYQMLTNALPFTDTTISALINRHLNEPPPPIRSLRPDIPPALEDLICRMMAKQPSDRPQRVGEIPDLFDTIIDDAFITVADERTILDSIRKQQSNALAPAPEQGPPIAPPPITPPPGQYTTKPPGPPITPPPGQYTTQPPGTPITPPPGQYTTHPQGPPITPPPGQYTTQPPGPYQIPYTTNPAPKSSKRGIGALAIVIGGVGLLFIVLVVGVAIFLYFGQSDGKWKQAVENERTAFRGGRYMDAINYAQLELNEAKAIGLQDPRYGRSLCNVGEVYSKLERFNEAERFLQAALNIQNKNENGDYARTLFTLADLEWHRGNSDKAERLFRQSLAIREKIFGGDHPDVAESLTGLAIVLRSRQIVEAEGYARRALSILEKKLGENDPAVADCLSTLAEVIIDIGKPSEIEADLRRAILIRERSLGLAHPDLGENLILLGIFYNKKGRCVDAQRVMRRGIGILENAYGKDHPVVARGCLELANVIATQDTFEFQRLSDRAIAIFNKASGPESKDMAYVFTVKGAAFLNLARYKDSETNYQRALAILEKTDRLKGEEVAEAYYNLASLYSKEGESTKAEAYSQSAQTTFENALGKDNPMMALQYLSHALYLGGVKKFDEANANLHYAQDGVRNATGSIRAPLVSMLTLTEATLRLSQGQYEQASQDMKNILISNDDSPLVSIDVINIGYFLSVIQQMKPINDGMASMIREQQTGGQINEVQNETTVQKIEIAEATAKRGLNLVETDQCKRHQDFVRSYKHILAVLYSVKAVLLDNAGKYNDAFAVLRDNRPIIQESLKQGAKSSTYNLLTQHITRMEQTGRYDDAQKLRTFVNEATAQSTPKN